MVPFSSGNSDKKCLVFDATTDPEGWSWTNAAGQGYSMMVSGNYMLARFPPSPPPLPPGTLAPPPPLPKPPSPSPPPPRPPPLPPQFSVTSWVRLDNTYFGTFYPASATITKSSSTLPNAAEFATWCENYAKTQPPATSAW